MWTDIPLIPGRCAATIVALGVLGKAKSLPFGEKRRSRPCLTASRRKNRAALPGSSRTSPALARRARARIAWRRAWRRQHYKPRVSRRCAARDHGRDHRRNRVIAGNGRGDTCRGTSPAAGQHQPRARQRDGLHRALPAGGCSRIPRARARAPQSAPPSAAAAATARSREAPRAVLTSRSPAGAPRRRSAGSRQSADIKSRGGRARILKELSARIAFCPRMVFGRGPLGSQPTQSK